MSFISIDVEADGPIPGKYSMVSFGAVVVEGDLSKTFYGKVKPISDEWIPDALAVSGHSRKEHEQFEDSVKVMKEFVQWIKDNSKGKATMISDNPAFDWQWINYYLWMFAEENPLGHSARRLGDLYCGLVGDASKNFEMKKKLRKTKHTHHPVKDAKGNAECLIGMKEMGLKIGLK